MSSKKGFTLIEGVLVLAIAGLIFAAIFIIFPSLQRAQRDAQRKQNLALIVSQLNSWEQTHRFTLSDSYNDFAKAKQKKRDFCSFYNDYIKEDLVDPLTGEPYKVALWGTTKVIDCQTGLQYDRGQFDPYVHVDPSKAQDSWALMEVGDMQYDDSAYCEGEAFNDHVGKNNGLKIFALRIRLENGYTYCLDNGSATTYAGEGNKR